MCCVLLHGKDAKLSNTLAESIESENLTEKIISFDGTHRFTESSVSALREIYGKCSKLARSDDDTVPRIIAAPLIQHIMTVAEKVHAQHGKAIKPKELNSMLDVIDVDGDQRVSFNGKHKRNPFSPLPLPVSLSSYHTIQ